ncbi:MAG: hypothetical protein N2595_00175 [bacterium]|nr:hypothetical protein [bacterium]
MAERRSQSYVTSLFIALAAVSLAWSTHLLLLEYLRFLIFGIAIALVFIALNERFMKHYASLCLLAGGYAYMILALDPAVNATTLFHTPAPPWNTYRLISLGLVATAALSWVRRDRRTAESWAEWLDAFAPRHRYALAIVCTIGALHLLLELLRALDADMSILQAVLRGTKWVDWACVYLAIVCGCGPSTSQVPKHPNLLIYTFLTFCGAVSLIGGLRATHAYYQARLPEKIDRLQGSRRIELLLNTVTPREQLLRVFSLNSHEALLVFEAGYYAGLEDREKYRARFRQLAKYPRRALQEIDVMEQLSDGNYAAAVRALEQFPLTYQFSILNRERAQQILANLAWAEPGSVADYVRGLLTLRCGEPVAAARALAQYALRTTNYVNPSYFARATGGLTDAFPEVSVMPAAGWLASLSPSKPLQEQPDHVTLLYNMSASGIVWLPTGAYRVTVWARDDGTSVDKARASGFDPACKLLVTVGDSTAFYTVLSTNRAFLPFTCATQIHTEPARITIEFANDYSDLSRGWDRNLSISHVEFHRQASL